MSTTTITESLESLIPKRNGKLLSQPFNLLLLIAILLLVLPIFFWGQGISIQLPKMIFFLTDKSYCRALALFLAICWLIYFFCWRKRLLTLYLTNIHIATTVILICWLILLSSKWIVAPQDNEVKTIIFRVLLDRYVKEIKLTSWKVIIFIAAQLCFLLNFMLGLIRKRKNRQQYELAKQTKTP